MADLQATYTISTGAGNIVLNAGPTNPFDTTDKLWISNIQGLDGPMLRVPVDMVPFGNGGIVHSSWKGPRRVLFDGWLIINSSRDQADCQRLRNDLMETLKTRLASIIAPTSGTMTWTIDLTAGDNSESLTVFYEVPVSFQHSDDYRVATFNFGLISEAADPT